MGYLYVANPDNTYKGGTEIGNGWIVVSDSLALGDGNINFSTASNSVLSITENTTFTQRKMTIGAAAADKLTNAAIFDVAAEKTAWVDSTIGVNTSYANYSNQVISVRKIGAGKLVLTASNTYAGTTSVEGGELSIRIPYLSSSNDVSLTSASKLNLDFGGTNTIAKLFIDGTQQYQGTWGSTNSLANNKTALITGTGLLRVINGERTPLLFSLPSVQLASYDGFPKPSQNPITTATDASFIVTYSSATYPTNSTPPSAVGTYDVLATANAPYGGSASSSLTINKGISSFDWPAIAPFTYTAGVGQGPVIRSKVGSSGAVTHYYKGVTPTTYGSQTNKPTNAGTYEVTASVPADNNYDEGSETRTFTIEKAPHTISLSSFGTKRYGIAPFPLPIDKGASTGALICSSSNENVATVSPAGEVTIVGVGTTTIAVTQAEDDNYQAATQVSQTLQVYKGNQSIIFATLPNKVFGESPFNLTATASSGLDVTYVSSNTSVATVLGNTVTIVGAGETVITASQAGNLNYNAAPAVEQTLTVDKGDQTITFGSLVSKKTGDASFTLGATASSALAVAYESLNPAVATVSGNTVTIVGVGSAVIRATQAGNANYNAAPTVEQTLTVTSSGTTFASWSGSAGLTSDLVYKYAFGAADKNSAAQKMTSGITTSTLSLTAVVRTDDTHLVITAKSISSLSGTWSAMVPTISVVNAADQTLNGAPLGTGLVRKVYSVDRGSDSKRFLKLEAVYTP